MAITIKSPIDDITGGKGSTAPAQSDSKSIPAPGGKGQINYDKGVPTPTASKPSMKTPANATDKTRY